MTIDQIKIEIKIHFPDIDFKDKSGKDNLQMEFSANTQLDYKYNIFFNSNPVCASVGATLLNAVDGQYFWYQPFDPYGAENKDTKINECKEFIIKAIDFLKKNRTRIIQNKRWFSQSFCCEYFQNETWTLYYEHSALRYFGNFDFPIISGKQKIYQ